MDSSTGEYRNAGRNDKKSQTVSIYVKGVKGWWSRTKVDEEASIEEAGKVSLSGVQIIRSCGPCATRSAHTEISSNADSK